MKEKYSINTKLKPEIQITIDPDVYRMAVGLCPASLRLESFINDTLTAGLSLELDYHAKDGGDDSHHAHMNALGIAV